MNAESTQTQQQPQTQQPEKHFSVELNSGEKCDGILVNIDKLNSKIQLKNVKKYPAKTEGNEVKTVEEFDILDIDKADIKEVQYLKPEEKEDKSHEVNVNAIPQDKIPTGVRDATTKTKNYDKNESFFDSLSSMTHPQAREESTNYNNKNTETFNLPNNHKEDQGNQNYYRGRGRGNRGRGRYGRGYHQNQYQQGGYNNKGYYDSQQGGYIQSPQGFNQQYYPNNQYQHYQGYNKGYNQEAFNQGGFNQQQRVFNQGYNNYHHTQGRGSGRGQGYNYNNRGAFNKGHFDFNQQPSNQIQEQKSDLETKTQPTSTKVEVEKNIYDEEKK